MNKVREGYKEYEFGVIPNDWQVKKLGDIFNDLKGGSTPSRLIDRYYTGDIPWITSGELKYKTIYNNLLFIVYFYYCSTVTLEPLAFAISFNCDEVPFSVIGKNVLSKHPS